MTNKIDFITAHNGGIKMFAGVGLVDNLKGWGKTAILSRRLDSLTV